MLENFYDLYQSNPVKENYFKTWYVINSRKNVLIVKFAVGWKYILAVRFFYEEQDYKQLVLGWQVAKNFQGSILIHNVNSKTIYHSKIKPITWNDIFR